MKRTANSPMETDKKKENRRDSSSSSPASSYATITSRGSPPPSSMANRRPAPRQDVPFQGAPFIDHGHTTTTDGP